MHKTENTIRGQWGKREEKEKKTEDKLQEQATSDQMHQQKVLKKVEGNGGEDEKVCEQRKS